MIPKFPQGQGRSQGDSGTKVLGQIVNKFNIQISTAFAFSDPVVDEIREIKDKASFDFNKYNLKDGAYYYRYSYVDDLGFQGRFSNPIRFEIDTKPPSLENIEPADGSVVDDTFVHLKGKTEPRSTLNVNGKTVWVENDGTFYTAIMSGKKKTDISITVKDRAGNTSQKYMTMFRDAGAMKERAVKKDFKVKSKGFSFISATLAVLTATVIIGVLVLILQ